MSTLTRNDGTQFVIQAYRELVKYKKKSLLVQRIKDIAKQQGQFIRLFKRKNGEFEAVFSSEPGYLLGESVKQYFQQARNLIFCEKLDNSQQSLLVIVKDGNVFTDTLVNDEDLKNELLPLAALHSSFQLFVSGDVPLCSSPELSTEDIFCFPPELTISYEHIDDPLLPRLPSLPAVRLLPLPLALKAERLHNDSLLSSGALLLVFFSVITGVFVYTAHQHHKSKQQLQQSRTDAPYAQFYAALHTPAPNVTLENIGSLMAKLYQIPGWQFVSLSQKGSFYRASVKADNGNLQSLDQWAKNNNMTIHLEQNGVWLTTEISAPARPTPTVIYPLTHTTENLIDTLSQTIEDSTINIEKTVRHPQSQETKLYIQLENISPDQLIYFKQLLTDLPVTLTETQFTISNDALISASMHLSVWGK